jgi:hypothetical protein
LSNECQEIINGSVDGRWSDIQAHETSRFAAGVQDDDHFPAPEGMSGGDELEN